MTSSSSTFPGQRLRSLRRAFRAAPFLATLLLLTSPVALGAFPGEGGIAFFEKHCYECHDDVVTKAGLDLYALSTDLSDPATMAKWVRIYDRVASGEMPPAKQPRPTEGEKRIFRDELAPPIAAAHEETKETVLRRLNRKEYQNTLSDLLGVRLDLIDSLPEDGRSGEFDTVGDALGISMVQMREYLAAAEQALDLAIADRTAAPEPKTKRASYAETRGVEKYLENAWYKAPDGAIVFYRELGYPSGMLREANAERSGYYRIRITGYAHQSDRPISFSVGADTYARGAKKPTFGYFSLPPGKPTTIELTAWIDERYMIKITPQGIHDLENEIRENGLANYRGPGLAIKEVELHGPLVEEFPSRGHKLIFEGLDRREIEPGNPRDKEKSWYQPRFEILSEDPSAEVAPVLVRFATAAFRRPADEETIAPYLILFQQALKDGEDFETALRTALTAILCSPRFLFFEEGPDELDGYALASRLSYLLTRSAPDTELLAAAASGELTRDPDALATHAARLIDSAESDRFVEDFTDSWLDLRQIEFTTPDRALFPEFDRYLQHAMVGETRAYFRELLDENLGIEHVVKSDFAMLNERIARHYGIEGVDSPEFERVTLPPDSPRGGFLSQASIHKVSANGTNTSPVLRGVWINERILGKHPAPPPPGIPGVEPDIRGAETLRELLDKHRDSESCQACHEMIDPPGFALESFDPVGRWRETFRSLNNEHPRPEAVHIEGERVRFRIGPPVDSGGVLPDGTPFSGYVEYRDLIARDQRQLAKAFVSKLLVFGTGRDMGFSDRPEINRIAKEAEAKGYGMRDLILQTVSSELFRHK